MKRIVNPCMCGIGNGQSFNAYAKIEVIKGTLTISGVIGPMSNGNCRGSCGQCVDEIREGTPSQDWTPEMLKKFCDIWEEWHLNDLSPYCDHQRELGWDKVGKEHITIYNFTTTTEVHTKMNAIKKKILDDCITTGTATVTPEEQKILSLPYFQKSITGELPADIAEFYKPTDIKSHYKSTTETKLKLHTYESDGGILCKPCPVCGYKCGSSWFKRELPQEVIDFLFSLPVTKTKPAWI